jgi:hypothetical protein
VHPDPRGEALDTVDHGSERIEWRGSNEWCEPIGISALGHQPNDLVFRGSQEKLQAVYLT